MKIRLPIKLLLSLGLALVSGLVFGLEKPVEISVDDLMLSEVSEEPGCSYYSLSGNAKVFKTLAGPNEIGFIRVNGILHKLSERPVKRKKLEGKLVHKWADGEISLEYQYRIVKETEAGLYHEGKMILRYKGLLKSFQVRGGCGC